MLGSLSLSLLLDGGLGGFNKKFLIGAGKGAASLSLEIPRKDRRLSLAAVALVVGRQGEEDAALFFTERTFKVPDGESEGLSPASAYRS